MDFSKIKHYIFAILLLGITILFLFIIRPFAYPILWAAIIAGLFYPVYKKLVSWTKWRNFSSAITLVLIFVIIVIPLIGIGTLVFNESMGIYDSVTNNSSQIGNFIQSITHWIQNNPYTEKLNINQAFWTQKFVDIAQTVTSYLIVTAKNFTQNSFLFLIMFVIMFYALFFFVRDGEKLLRKLMHLFPLGDRNEKMLYNKFISTTRATLKGSLIIGLIQGGLGGLMFLVAGIQGAVIWGILMVLLATIPGIGAALIWAPAAIIMMIIGKFWTGIAMLIFGLLVISTIDNIIRPLLVGKDTQMHPLLVLFSTLGGIIVFGASGFVIGPVITALLMAFWDMYEQNYKTELDNN